MALPINIDELLRAKAGNGNFLATMPIHNKMMHTILEQVKELLSDRIRIIKVDVDKYGMTANQPMKQREQKPNLFGLCRVVTEEGGANYAANAIF